MTYSGLVSTENIKFVNLSSRLKSAFNELDDPGEVFLAICAEDSSIVYYKLSMGINKPPV
jgi:tRNA-splicing endonuclease subunit Sen15